METCCGYGYGPARDSHRLARIFKGRQRRSGHRKSRGALRQQRPYLRASRFQGVRALLRKENSHRGLCRRLRGRLRCRTGPASGTLSVLGFGNIDPIPFRWEQGVYLTCLDSAQPRLSVKNQSRASQGPFRLSTMWSQVPSSEPKDGK